MRSRLRIKGKKNQNKPKKVIKISGGGARPLGGPRPLGPFDPSIIRRKGQKKPKKAIKISGGGARPLGGPRPLDPFDPSINRRQVQKTKKNQKTSSKHQLRVGGTEPALDH